jgi:AcrR family transcriptional regulator
MVYSDSRARRDKRRGARRERILDAAFELVSEAGLDGLTIGALALRLDYTPGALYRYFSSKEALMAGLEGRALEVVYVALSHGLERLSERRTGVSEQVAALSDVLELARLYTAQLDAHRDAMQLIGRMLAEPRPLVPDSLLPEVVTVFEGLLGLVAERFERAQRCGALCSGSGRDRALLYWASIQGALQLDKLSRLDPDRFDPRRLVPSLASVLLRGWGASESRLDAALTLCSEHHEGAKP